MKVVHINSADSSGALAAVRLHEAMLKSGIDSIYFVQNRTITGRSDIKTISRYENYILKIINLVREKIAVSAMHGIPGLFSSFKYGIDISKRPEIIDADVIYLHWICNSFINFRVLKRILKIGKPVFWFMHDMFPITGGCHHSFDCTNYYSRCFKCPYYNKKFFFIDISSRQFSIKHRIYRQFNNLTFLAPSKWLAECAGRSNLTSDKPIYHIPNLIDHEKFKIINMHAARELFLIDHNKKIICFGADNALTNPYKGWSFFKDALYILGDDYSLKEIEIVIFGSAYDKKIADDIPFASHFLGRLYDEYSMVMIYNCADVFVIPSLADNFPNSILESLSCNTPVVGFNVGGIPDMVNENTGYLAEYKNSNDLAKGIAMVLRDEKKSASNYVKLFTQEVILPMHRMMWKPKFSEML
jgi:glycosyltransferase involved in cell wall biosynthesis